MPKFGAYDLATTPLAGTEITLILQSGATKRVAVSSLVATELAGLSSITGTGIVVRSAAATYITRSLAGTANEITVANGSAVAGTPTISLPAAVTLTGKTMTGGTYAGVTSVQFGAGTALSVYAEGTWTPSLAFSTPGSSTFGSVTATGTYTRIGNRVFLTFNITFTPTFGTGSGVLDIGGLPYTAANADAAGSFKSMNNRFTYPAGYTSASPALSSTTLMGIFVFGTGVASGGIGVANMTDGQPHVLIGSLSYPV